MRKKDAATLLLIPILLLTVLAPDSEARRKSKEQKAAEEAAIAALPEEYQNWLAAVELIISDAEKKLFLDLAKDYQRDAYIERFWAVRDPIKRTARNEFREDWNERLALAADLGYDDRARTLLLNGFPVERFIIDRCTPEMWPMEVWYYVGSEKSGSEFLLLFYKVGATTANYRIWDPIMGLRELIALPGQNLGSLENAGRALQTRLEAICGIEQAEIVTAGLVQLVSTQGGVTGASTFIFKIREPPEPPSQEWVATFSTYSTELPENAATFDANVEVDFPGRNQSRTVLQGAVEVSPDAVKLAEIGQSRSYNLKLNGEILLEGKLFENFHYQYNFTEKEVENAAALPLVFQRYLRPGDYQLLLKVEDLNAQSFFRYDEPLTVPQVDEARPPAPTDPETARILAEANAAIASGENTIKIIQPSGEWQTGLLGVNTMTTGNGIDSVKFILDGTDILTKRRAPYGVEIDLGNVPRARTLRVEAFDEEGKEVANDEVLLNAGQHRFAVRLVEPRRNKTYTSSLRAQADVQVPEGEIPERVEFFLNETLVATVYQPPYIQPIILPDEMIGYVRAVAYTTDGNSTEDVVFINAPDYLEEVDVDFVELYTTVLDKQSRPVDTLTQANFTVTEDGVQQEIVRFDQVRDLPIHVVVMLDISASMIEELEETRKAALKFFNDAIQPKDRAAIITFNDHPNLVSKLTNDPEILAGGLAGLKAERGTALYDSLIFTLYYFNGIKGQRAVLLLSDGKDESSRFEYDDAMEFANRAGVAIYSIGLKLSKKEGDARRKLTRLSEETGGRSYFIDDEAQLSSIYDAIQRELRSRYLIAYQSSNVSGSTRFRTVEVEVDESGLDAKTIRGYYP